MKNIFSLVPQLINQEIFDELFKYGSNIRIERILSQGQTSPDTGWYDQDEHEWIIVIEGAGLIGFVDGSEIRLEKGDFLNIPRHQKHRVKWTDPDNTTIWLAIFYN